MMDWKEKEIEGAVFGFVVAIAPEQCGGNANFKGSGIREFLSITLGASKKKRTSLGQLTIK